MGMKRFIIRLLVFLSLMFMLDRGFGVAMKYLQENAKGGYVGHHNYILNQANEDILIFGSSRAIHHYNPQIIEDSLGMSCYNCGQDGNGIVLFYGWWQILKNRHLPKMIIYDVNPSFDLLVGENNSKYLGWLRSEFENDDVKHIFEDIDPTEKYKMQSMMYRYNSKFLQNVIDYVHPIFQISPNGYLPLKGEMDRMKVKELSDEKGEYLCDSLKLSYLEAFMRDVKGRDIRLIMVASPIWYGRNQGELIAIKQICDKHGISFYDMSNDERFVRNDDMFKDGNHLNNRGADEFSKIVCNLINDNAIRFR